MAPDAPDEPQAVAVVGHVGAVEVVAVAGRATVEDLLPALAGPPEHEAGRPDDVGAVACVSDVVQRLLGRGLGGLPVGRHERRLAVDALGPVGTPAETDGRDRRRCTTLQHRSSGYVLGHLRVALRPDWDCFGWLNT
jgi:hypothetical protein